MYKEPRCESREYVDPKALLIHVPCIFIEGLIGNLARCNMGIGLLKAMWRMFVSQASTSKTAIDAYSVEIKHFSPGKILHNIRRMYFAIS